MYTKLTEEVFHNISDVYKRFYIDDKYFVKAYAVKSLAEDFIHVFDFRYESGFMYDERKEFQPYKPKIPKYRITPIKLDSLYEKELTDIINKNVDFINDLCPLYECIGYVIYLESDIARIGFKGSYIYDIYKDFSYEILNSDIPDWRSVEDGYNINIIHSPNWLEEIK